MFQTLYKNKVGQWTCTNYGTLSAQQQTSPGHPPVGLTHRFLQKNHTHTYAYDTHIHMHVRTKCPVCVYATHTHTRTLTYTRNVQFVFMPHTHTHTVHSIASHRHI